MLRFGLIGAGRIGKIHGHNAAARSDARLVAVADADRGAAEALAGPVGARAVSVEEAATASDIDAVMICAPTDMHADLIEQAARAGKAIFCEKPVDLSSDRIRSTLAVVARAGVPLMIGFNRRYDPNFAALKERLDAGTAGAVELVSIISRDPAPPPVSYIARSGGIFRDMVIHDFDMARFLLGEEPIAVTATGSALVDPAIGEAGDFDTVAVLLETRSGRIAQITGSRRATYGYDQRVEVHGSKGLLRVGNHHETTLEFASAAGLAADPVQNFFLERYAAAYRLELDAFVKAVTAGTAIRPDGHDGLRAQVLSDAATLSAQEHRRVAVSAD